jgi:hypothetical protein
VSPVPDRVCGGGEGKFVGAEGSDEKAGGLAEFRGGGFAHGLEPHAVEGTTFLPSEDGAPMRWRMRTSVSGRRARSRSPFVEFYPAIMLDPSNESEDMPGAARVAFLR